MSEKIGGIDRIDRRLLTLLQEDGRIANLRLAQLVNLSPTAVLERVKRLTRDGFILGYEGRLNPNLLGAGLMVFVEVQLDRTAPEAFEKFQSAIKARPEILECHMVAGNFDYLLKVRVADMAAYKAFVANVIANLPAVRETRSFAVIDEVKSTTRLQVEL
ncbi:MAG: Lrp/AsnC ligand binding domain-containing protein [Thiomonas sp.]|uniref:Lrp/AsnC ligand binding domain-containing protein n=1 Tax=Thiomonas sp. TaxID=2047785 RepID=UPI002A363722|nr:Lrp/AsnC ligand binding domain-containing protein [Thiomonas sp.]MDY0330899.1 Lrp/AsnC ligand binding domain-containing protein [Thiomonas sp.]